MKTADLDAAISEAQRFLRRAKDLRQALRTGTDPVNKLAGLVSVYIDGHPVEQGYVKRASMDLSRSLSQLRK
jgi:hypothetical protein